MTPPSPSREEQIETLLREYPPQHKHGCDLLRQPPPSVVFRATHMSGGMRATTDAERAEFRVKLKCDCGLDDLLAALRSSVPPDVTEVAPGLYRVNRSTSIFAKGLPAPPVEKD